ncbi:MAG: radical SAM protein [Dehalococcoidia bacterium]|nr:radical SAM protein [Dehalococcoidia bacterium]
MSACNLCPRQCGVNRLEGELGFCRSGAQPVVSSFCAHHGEEPVISGTQGSGTVFFANCNMRCLFCQNFQISQNWAAQQSNITSVSALADVMLGLQTQGCHNINFVSPSHFVPQILQALELAVPRGLKIPLVYNTNGYDAFETLLELDGIIDIYLPDLKYADDKVSQKYSLTSDYVQVARSAIKEMFRQTGDLSLDANGLAVRGVIVRHLILPNKLAGSHETLTWLANQVSSNIAISLMSQYHPLHMAYLHPEIGRRITRREYDSVLETLYDSELENGWIQDPQSAEDYLPNFNDTENPFENKRPSP